MAVTIKATEGAPAEYPEVTVSTDAEPFLSAAWQRIEAYTAFRTTGRDVEWIAEGCGEWVPPLRPATIATTEKWTGSAWEAIGVSPSPLGYCLPGGTFRLIGTAGDDDADVPLLITEAVRRLATYMAADPGTPGARSETRTTDEVGSDSLERSPTWIAQALQLSGAADLLRNFRRA